jgi:hypothetical protein
MSENIEKIQAVRDQVRYMEKLITLYEHGKIDGPAYDGESFSKVLTAGEITTLKQRFVTARTACKALLDGITP